MSGNPVGVILVILGKVMDWFKPFLLKNFYKAKYFFIRKKFNVALCVDYEAGTITETYCNELYNHLLSLIQKNSLERLLTVSNLSGVYSFSNKFDAEKFVTTPNKNLVIWGRFSPNNLKIDNKSVSELTLNFSYIHPDIGSLNQNVNQEILSVLAQKKLDLIYEEDSYRQIKYVNRKVFDIGVYIIALCLKLYGEFSKSLQLFKSLYQSIDTTDDLFSQGVKFHLINLYEVLIINNAWSGRFDAQLGYKLSSELQQIDPDNKLSFVSKAYACVFLNRPDEVAALVDELQCKYPNSPVTWVDIAYIKLIQGNYKAAFKYYSKLEDYNSDLDKEFSVVQVIEFLENEYDRSCNPVFLYGAGILNVFFKDSQRGKELLEKFISSTKEEADSDMKYMIRHAKDLSP